jgi:hypothetical protein
MIRRNKLGVMVGESRKKEDPRAKQTPIFKSELSPNSQEKNA